MVATPADSSDTGMHSPKTLDLSMQMRALAELSEIQVVEPESNIWAEGSPSLERYTEAMLT